MRVREGLLGDQQAYARGLWSPTLVSVLPRHSGTVLLHTPLLTAIQIKIPRSDSIISQSSACWAFQLHLRACCWQVRNPRDHFLKKLTTVGNSKTGWTVSDEKSQLDVGSSDRDKTASNGRNQRTSRVLLDQMTDYVDDTVTQDKCFSFTVLKLL